MAVCPKCGGSFRRDQLLFALWSITVGSETKNKVDHICPICREVIAKSTKAIEKILARRKRKTTKKER